MGTKRRIGERCVDSALCGLREVKGLGAFASYANPTVAQQRRGESFDRARARVVCESSREYARGNAVRATLHHCSQSLAQVRFQFFWHDIIVTANNYRNYLPKNDKLFWHENQFMPFYWHDRASVDLRVLDPRVKFQYLGDVNDYLKYGLLRCFAEGGFRVGVCWMLTSDDGRSDGGKISYLKQPEIWQRHNPELYELLRHSLARPVGRQI